MAKGRPIPHGLLPGEEYVLPAEANDRIAEKPSLSVSGTIRVIAGTAAVVLHRIDLDHQAVSDQEFNQTDTVDVYLRNTPALQVQPDPRLAMPCLAAPVRQRTRHPWASALATS